MGTSQVQKIRKALDRVGKNIKFKNMNSLKVTKYFILQ